VGEIPTAEQTYFIKRNKKVQRDTYKGREGGGTIQQSKQGRKEAGGRGMNRANYKASSHKQANLLSSCPSR
jgi:hypothetical protein